MGVRGQHLVRLEALWRREQWRQSKPERWTQYLQTAKGKKAHLCWEATKEWTGRCSWEMKMRWKRILNSGLIDQVGLAQAEDTDNFPKGRATSWESSDMSLRSIWLLYKGRQGYCLNNATPWPLLTLALQLHCFTSGSFVLLGQFLTLLCWLSFTTLQHMQTRLHKLSSLQWSSSVHGAAPLLCHLSLKKTSFEFHWGLHLLWIYLLSCY